MVLRAALVGFFPTLSSAEEERILYSVYVGLERVVIRGMELRYYEPATLIWHLRWHVRSEASCSMVLCWRWL